MRRCRCALVVAMLAFAAAPELAGQATGRLKVRLDAIAKAQAEARLRYSKELEGRTTEEAQRPAQERYLAELDKNVREVLGLVRANPNDPAVVEALDFVIKTAGRGPGDASYQAMELLRDHVRDPGMGDICGRIFHFGHVPVAESL